MKKELLERLVRYQNKILDRMSSPVNEKHKNHPEALKHYLKNELRLVTSKIEEVKLEGK